MKSLAIFASGKGSNALNMIEYFRDNKKVNVTLIVSSNKDAGVLQIAKKNKVPAVVLDKKEYYGSGEKLIQVLKKYRIDGIVLAGFLWLIPEYLIFQFPGRIINIHPALLPKYGGKGMYGMYVHEAVWKNREKKSGITIHEVDTHYDEGNIIFQATCTIDKADTPYEIAQKVQTLEYEHFPKVIEDFFIKT
ncbi:MAG: phosphoribosylglycinamide formyltransferase [Saprospiraceae bacterium]